MPPVGVEWRGHCIHLFGGEEDVDWKREGIKRGFPNRGGKKVLQDEATVRPRYKVCGLVLG